MIGIVFAAALTCKVSAIIFLPIVLLSLITPLLSKEGWSRFIGIGVVSLKQIMVRLSLFGICALIFAFLFMPYAFIDYVQFLSDVTAQVRMNSDPYVFPYTLQYVGTMPYIYYLKNIFIWGLGPVISILALVGLLHNRSYKKHALFFLFYLIYVIIIGKSAVKFMRYMLLMYPFFAIMAG